MRQRGFAHILVLIIAIVLAVGGIGYYAYKNGQIKTIAPSESSLAPTSAQDTTSNLKTYSNTTHNISFNYPSDWILNEKTGQSESGKIYNGMVELKKADATITMYLNMTGIGGQPQTYEGESFILDGYNLYKYRRFNSYNNTKQEGIANSLTTLTVFDINGITYSITLMYPANYDVAEEKNVLEDFNQILSTFEFTD